MDEIVLKWLTCFLCGLTVISCVIFLYLPHVRTASVMAAVDLTDLQYTQDVEEAADDVGMDGIDIEENATVIQMQNSQILTQTDENTSSQLQIELPEGIKESDVEIENNYVSQTILLRIPTEVEDYFSQYRVRGSCAHVAQLLYYQKGQQGIIMLELDQVYEVNTHFADGNLYLDFVDPHEIYDKVIVVDAGHGGKAVGVVKLNICEKDINLGIVQQFKKIMDDDKSEDYGKIGVYYTRLDDSNPTWDQRVQLANKVHADLFISIHNNASHSGNFSGLKGTQVLYSQSDESELSSKKFAQICLQQMCKSLKSKKVGLLAADDIYIVRTSEVPVALIEVGFVTNKEELSLLKTTKYQKKAAEGIYASVKKAFDEGY